MTNHWNDLQYSDVLMVIGANPAENHPIGFRWITKALKNGATLISVDPRFTRTSQLANIYGQLRSGTDIAFIGGMINYILENHLYHEEYVANYTNASYILSDAYSFEDGIFSGYDEIERKYDTSKWSFETDAEGNVLVDKTLQHPRCVFQLMKQHYSRYNLETVTSITGTDRDTYLEICKVFGSTGQVGKAGTILYAMGGTQHTVGTQNIRIFAIIQLLLGNIGIVGGGVNALRGESNVQGSTDFGLLYHSLPGYIDVPKAVPEENKEDAFVDGMDKVYKQLMKTLEEAGVKPIEAVGKEFDPNFHNAVMHVENEELGENVVAAEFQKGYTYKETVVRHSMVQVAN